MPALHAVQARTHAGRERGRESRRAPSPLLLVRLRIPLPPRRPRAARCCKRQPNLDRRSGLASTRPAPLHRAQIARERCFINSESENSSRGQGRVRFPGKQGDSSLTHTALKQQYRLRTYELPRRTDGRFA